MTTGGKKLIRFVCGLIGLGILLLAGCATSTAPAKKAAPAAPGFADDVTAAEAVLEAKGESPADAARDAQAEAAREVAAADRLHRLAQVKPLLKALVDSERPRGAWEFTATTTTTHEGKASVTVEHFDPSKSDEGEWTLVSVDGKPPEKKERDTYRQEKTAWLQRARATRSHRNESEQVRTEALFDIFTVAPAASGVGIESTFIMEPARILPTISQGQFEADYFLDPSSGKLLREARTLLYPVGEHGRFTIDLFESSADYVVVDEAMAPFVAKTVVKLKMHTAGVDRGETDIKVAYTGYRFLGPKSPRGEFHVGLPQLIDFLPSVK